MIPDREDRPAILWFIEHISRELDVACAVSALVEKTSGRAPLILPYAFSYPSHVVCSFRPDLIVLPYCYRLDDSFLSRLVFDFPDATFLNLSWEQIFYSANLEYKAPRDAFAKRFVLHHVWSTARKRFLLHTGVPRDHIFVNGHPAFKLYDSPYKDVFVSRTYLARTFGLDPKKTWVFFPENYSWFFYSSHQLEHIISQGQNRETAYLMRAYCRKSFSTVVSWLQECAENIHGIEIILRPRPSFSASYFLRVLGQFLPQIPRSLRILKDYSVREWIMASDIVLSSFSTSLIESAIAGKPTFMLVPHPLPPLLSASWYRYVPKIYHKNDFFALCSSRSPVHADRLRVWARSQFLSHDDPISGLVDIFLSCGAFSHAQQCAYIRAQVMRGFPRWQMSAQDIWRNLGRVKRFLSPDRSYFRNDDAAHYAQEIQKKTAVYRKFLGVHS